MARARPRDVFVIGAGFSRSVWSRFPLTANLYDACLSVMHEEHLPTADNVDALSAYTRFMDFETWLTWLGGQHPWLNEAQSLRQRAAFLDVSRALARVILRAQNTTITRAKGHPPDWLQRLVDAWANRNAAVITLNYDSLIEKTYTQVLGAASVLYTFPLNDLHGAARYAGERTFRFDLLKLHGSIAWYVFTSGGGTTAGPVYDANLSDGWEHADDEAALETRVGSRRPLIVPPIVGKDPFLDRPELRDQWVRAGYVIAEAERIFVVGYRMPEADLAVRFLLDQMPKNCTIFAVTPSVEVANRLGQMFAPRVVDRRYCGRQSVVRELAEAYGSIPALV